MEFNELKMIWDSQNQEPLYAMNEAALHGIVQRRNAEWNSCLRRCFAAEIAVGLVCTVVVLTYAVLLVTGNASWVIKPSGNGIVPTRWHILGLLSAGGIWLYYAAYMFAARKRQQRRAEVFDSTLRGDLDRALAQTEFQIALAKNITWRGLGPVWVAATLWMVILLQLKGASTAMHFFMGAVALGSFVVVVSQKYRSIKDRFQPRQRELESLRAKLADPRV